MRRRRDRRPHGSADGPPTGKNAARVRAAQRARVKRMQPESAVFNPQAPTLIKLVERAYPSTLAEGDDPAVSQVLLVPLTAFDAEDVLPLLEGPVNGVYHRIERPDEGVMLFAFDEGKLACWATTEPERWIGFDPRDQIVYEDWQGTFEEATRRTKGGMLSRSVGAAGRNFEGAFEKALNMLDLQFESSKEWSATVWDIKPVGPGWHRLIADRNTNLKVAAARHLWTAGGADLYKRIRACVQAVDDGRYDEAEAMKRMKRAIANMLKTTGAKDTAFLKPKSKDIQAKIERAVKRGDKAALRNVMVRDSFASKRLGLNASIEIVGMDWNAEHAERMNNKLPGSWQSGLNIRIDGGVESKFGVTGRIDSKGGIFTVAFRDRQGKPAAKHHPARTEGVDEVYGARPDGTTKQTRRAREQQSVLEKSPTRSSIRRPRKQGEGPSSVYGGVRFHVGHNKNRKPRKDVARSIQNRRNAKGGTGRKVDKLKRWHRSREGMEMHKQLGRYNRDHNRRKLRDSIVDVRERIARWQADIEEKGYVGESAIGIGGYRQVGGLGGYVPAREGEKTLDDIFEGLLRKLVVMEALDVLQDVEFEDASGSIYLFFDPSLPADEMEEIMQALQTEESELALVASPDNSLPGETVGSNWWVVFLPGKAGEDGQPMGPDSRVYSAEQEPGSKVQVVKTGPPSPAEQLAKGIDVNKILKAMGGK